MSFPYQATTLMSPGMRSHTQSPSNQVVCVWGGGVPESFVSSPYTVNKCILCNNATQRQTQRTEIKGNTSPNSATLASSLLFPPSSVATSTFPCTFHIQAVPITECVILESQGEPHLILSDPPALHLLTLGKVSHLYRYTHPGCCPWPVTLAMDDVSVQVRLLCRLLLHLYTHPACCSYPCTYIMHVAPIQVHKPRMLLLPRYTHPARCSCPGTHTMRATPAQVHTPTCYSCTCIPTLHTSLTQVQTLCM